MTRKFLRKRDLNMFYCIYFESIITRFYNFINLLITNRFDDDEAMNFRVRTIVK